jgi:hypothetical protein
MSIGVDRIPSRDFDARGKLGLYRCRVAVTTLVALSKPIWFVPMPWGPYELNRLAKFCFSVVVGALCVFWNESIELWKGSGGRRRGSRRVVNARAEEPVKRSRSFLAFCSFSGTQSPNRIARVVRCRPSWRNPIGSRTRRGMTSTRQ